MADYVVYVSFEVRLFKSTLIATYLHNGRVITIRNAENYPQAVIIDIEVHIIVAGGVQVIRAVGGY